MFKRYLNENEMPLFQVTKRKGPILFMIIFMPVWFFFATVILKPCFRLIFMGDMTFKPQEFMLAGIIGLIAFLPVAIVILLSYFLNQIMITDQRIYIRKGVSGRVFILDVSEVRSFQYVVSSGRYQSNHKIQFYMKCGKTIKTGELYSTWSSLENLLALLRDKYEGRGFTSRELKQMGLEHQSCQLITKRIWLAYGLTLAPFVLSLLLACLYFGGGNKIGPQKDIEVIGTIKEARALYNEKEEITGYELDVIEQLGDKSLTIPINVDTYVKFEQDDAIMVKAKRGSLGILYDQELMKK